MSSVFVAPRTEITTNRQPDAFRYVHGYGSIIDIGRVDGLFKIARPVLGDLRIAKLAAIAVCRRPRAVFRAIAERVHPRLLSRHDPSPPSNAFSITANSRHPQSQRPSSKSKAFETFPSDKHPGVWRPYLRSKSRSPSAVEFDRTLEIQMSLIVNRSLSSLRLASLGLNQGFQCQRLTCYHCTTGEDVACSISDA